MANEQREAQDRIRRQERDAAGVITDTAVLDIEAITSNDTFEVFDGASEAIRRL